MAARTTTAPGAWSSTGTWTGGLIPGAGDTATINHAVSLTDARTVGVSPGAGAGTPAILCNAALTISGTGVLTCRGDIGLAGNDLLVLQAGAILEFDAHLASSPSTALYVCGSTGFGNARILIQGSSGSRCTVRSNAGGGNGRFANPEVAEITADYCDFARIGDASNPAWAGALESTGQKMHFGHCTFDSGCGQIGNQFGVAAASDTIVELINVTHRGAVSLGLPSDVFTTGTRTVSGCRFAGDVAFYRIDGYAISDTVFEGFFDYTGGPWGSFSNNMFAMPSAMNDYGAVGDVVDSYVLRVGSPTNQHGLTSTDFTANIDGVIYDMPDGTDGAGDCFTLNAPSAPQTITVKNCIVLPNSVGDNVGTLLSCLGGANLTISAEHNTYNAGFGVYLGETYAGYAGMCAFCRSNLAWNATASTAHVIQADAGVIQDVVTSANAHHNGKYNPIGTGYDTNLSFSSGSPGTGDISGDPLFVDRTRTIKTWDAALGGAGTVANALTELRKQNDAAGYNSAYTIAALRAYIRAGFVVQNTSMRTGAHDGTVMGAVQSAPPLQAPTGPWAHRMALQSRY